uniref:Immunoglobulin subtype domain-containing protein n=1 Tax=Amphiprion percula TaxID=161767 RepID=A0A3P8TNB4_AMPPE
MPSIYSSSYLKFSIYKRLYIVLALFSFLKTYYVPIFFTGSSAVTPVFVQKGKDVLLEVKENVVLKETDILFWRFNQTSILVRLTPGKNPVIFKESVSFLTNYSVKLKNLQAADSGVYDARVIGATERKLVEYNITVQVSPVKLNVDSVLSSSDSCIVNATCSTSDSDISSSFRCVNQTCDQDKGKQSKTTNSGAFLNIYLWNASIFCNHSNQVSWTENMIEIQDFCLQPAVKMAKGISQKCDLDASCVSPTSTYSLVGLHSRPAEARDNPLPESLYATVDKPAKTEKPARPCKNLQEL